jgi:glycine/D-amino acid oxidase-like deaminating enzyme
VGIDRRDFLKVATAGAGLAISATSVAAETLARAPLVRSGAAPDVVVIGGGAFGMWTALYLQRQGAKVTVVDQYGPANSRATSGGETRGVRSSYGDRPHGLQWGRWAIEAAKRWTAWDEENQDDLLPRVYYNTGDVIMRDEMTPFMQRTTDNWDELGYPYEVISADEVHKRWPVIEVPDVSVAIYDAGAGIVRARRAIESVAKRFVQEGGTIVVGKVEMGSTDGRMVSDIVVDGSQRISGGNFQFALGPWFPKFFPELMGKRLRIRTLGHAYYFSTPPGDERYRFPNLPSYNVPGVTGWPALPNDARGFRIRTGGHRGDDPDTSVRWIDEKYHERPREVLRKYFPQLADRAINETRCCHYESSVDSQFIIDHHPDFDNAWLTGGGSAEAFKQGPVLGDYIAGRILGQPTKQVFLGTQSEEDLTTGFRLKDEEFEEGQD